MDKREALEIYLKLHEECVRRGCKDCIFKEPYNGRKICILLFTYNNSVAESVKAKLKDMKEKQEESSTPPENVGGIIIKPNEHTNKLIDEAIREHRENVKNELESGRIVTEIVIPKGVDRGVLPSSVIKTDNVNHPKHYCKGGLECIQVIKAQLTPEQYEGYLYGNVIKYM